MSYIKFVRRHPDMPVLGGERVIASILLRLSQKASIDRRIDGLSYQDWLYGSLLPGT